MTHILEDLTHKMEGQPPKKDVIWVLGIYIYIYSRRYLIYPPLLQVTTRISYIFLRFGNPNHKKPSCAQERHLGGRSQYIYLERPKTKKRSEAEKTCKFPPKKSKNLASFGRSRYELLYSFLFSSFSFAKMENPSLHRIKVWSPLPCWRPLSWISWVDVRDH